MNILYLSQLVPFPLDAGPKVRSYYVLRHLAAAGHAVTLIAFERDSDTKESLDHLRHFCEDVHTVPLIRSRSRDAYHFGRSLVSGQPFLITRDHVNTMYRVVRTQVSSDHFDAVHADQLWMAPYAMDGVGVARSRPRLVLDQHNAVHLVPQRLAAITNSRVIRQLLQREHRLMARYERDACRRFDDVVWVTGDDWAAVAPPEGPRHHVIPICVDTDAQPVLNRVARPHRVTFLGGLHWPPNAEGIVWFARDVWPRLLADHPTAVLTVIGKSPPPALVDLPGIEVTGFIHDPESYLCETAAFVVPLHAGGGMRVKILDAWAWGLPVISTTIGAEGLAARDGRDLLIADDATSFAAGVARVLDDDDLARGLASEGRRTVTNTYNIRTAYRAWDAIYPVQTGPDLAAPLETHDHVIGRA